MPRSKNAVASKARRKKILKQAKGFYGKRKNVLTVAKNVVEKGMTYMFVGRKLKKENTVNCGSHVSMRLSVQKE